MIAFAIIPQIIPSFIANNLYILDRNVKMATMLGLVGAGGIGYELQSSFRMFEYQRVSAIIIIIFITIFLIDHISSFIRSKVKWWDKIYFSKLPKKIDKTYHSEIKKI